MSIISPVLDINKMRNAWQYIYIHTDSGKAEIAQPGVKWDGVQAVEDCNISA